MWSNWTVQFRCSILSFEDEGRLSMAGPGVPGTYHHVCSQLGGDNFWVSIQ